MQPKERQIRRLPEVGTRTDRGLFQYTPQVILLSDADRALGELVKPLFDNRFNRAQPLEIDLRDIDRNPLAGRVIINFDNAFQRAKVIDPTFERQEPFDINTNHKVIPLAALNKERISARRARLITDAWKTELLLPDFSQAGQEVYGRIPGLHEGYIKWSDEELFHHLILGEILVRACGWNRDQLARERELTLTRKWVPSFASQRQMIVYAESQEAATNRNYKTLALNIRENPDEVPPVVSSVASAQALVAAELLEEIGRQEAFHFAWYRSVVELYHQLDPAGTEQDVYNVFRNFYMPSDPLLTLKNYPTRAEDYRIAIGMNEITMAKILYDVYSRHEFTDDRKLALIGGRNAGIIQLPVSRLDIIQSMSPAELTHTLENDDELAKKLDTAKLVMLSPKAKFAVA